MNGCAQIWQHRFRGQFAAAVLGCDRADIATGIAGLEWGKYPFVLAVEVGGRWNDDSQALVRQLVRVRALRAPPALRAAASSAWTRRWWGMLSTAVQHAVGGTALGAPWLVSKGAAGCEPALDHVLALAEPAGPSRLPLR